MKTTKLRLAAGIILPAILAACPQITFADDTAPSVIESVQKQRTFEGTVKSVDEKERMLAVESMFLTRSFVAGEHCRVQMEEKPVAALKDLKAGHRVKVTYLRSDGVNVAVRMVQENAVFTGHITSIDATGKTFKVKSGLATKSFAVAGDCKFTLREDKGRGFGDLKLGHKVTVRYAGAARENLAFKVEQASQVFAGTVEAIDAEANVVKARQLMANKRFILGDDCQIILDGRIGGKLRDLRIGDKAVFHYENVEGVLIANRLAREAGAPSETKSEQLTRNE